MLQSAILDRMWQEVKSPHDVWNFIIFYFLVPTCENSVLGLLGKISECLATFGAPSSMTVVTFSGALAVSYIQDLHSHVCFTPHPSQIPPASFRHPISLLKVLSFQHFSSRLSFPFSETEGERVVCVWLLNHWLHRREPVCLARSNEPISFNCEGVDVPCHMFQNSSCCGSSVIFHGIFNPGQVVKDASIDANISSQNTAICIRQDSIKYPVADCWGSRDFLWRKKTRSSFRQQIRNPMRKGGH